MLKGYQRKLIMMPTRDSSLFETAYFVLRSEAESRRPEPSQNEMLLEASRILQASNATRSPTPLTKKHVLLAALLGFLFGALCALLAVLLR